MVIVKLCKLSQEKYDFSPKILRYKKKVFKDFKM